MKVNNIIFDLDGVIVNTEPIHCEAYIRAFLKYDLKLTEHEYNLHLRARGRAVGLLPLIGQNQEELIEKICDEKDAQFDYITENEPIEIFEDAIKLIDVALKNNISIAIGTASRRGRILLDKTGLRERFKVVVTSKDVKHSKPSPEIYKLCKERLGAKENNTIVIEDSDTGVIAALRANLRVVFVKRENAPQIAEKYLQHEHVYCYNSLDDVWADIGKCADCKRRY